jgi:N-acetylneuraminic acid mutarotase
VAAGNVSNVQVSCLGTWTWVGGAEVRNAPGIYGSLGSASSGNAPGARYGAASWTDAAGNFWLFGGFGYDSNGNQGYLNDLWEYSQATQAWTWVGGSNVDEASGSYGTLDNGSTNNVPGARDSAVAWVDGAGNFWLFGGAGVDSTGTQGILNDLWEYSTSNQQWTWVGGANTAGAAGSYGAKGTPAGGNVPGARWFASGWTDASGNLWLFGGVACNCDSWLNDLWQFNPTTQQWTWMSGSSSFNAAGSYGAKGIAASSNVPGARGNAYAWTDKSGNLWLLGGALAEGTASNIGNDLWEYNVAANQWTWIAGSNSYSAGSVYGTLGTAAPGNVPGARQAGASWVDAVGDLWLFGGTGVGGSYGPLNDFWKFNIASNEWTWMGGAQIVGSSGSFGVMGTPSVSNIPSAREALVTWVDPTGALWLLGGSGYDSTGSAGLLNDLWRY